MIEYNIKESNYEEKYICIDIFDANSRCGCDSFWMKQNYSDDDLEGGYYDTEAGLNAVVHIVAFTLLRKRVRLGSRSEPNSIIAAGRDVDNNMAAYTSLGWNEILPVLFILTVFMQR